MRGAEQLPVFVATPFGVVVFEWSHIDSVLLAALEQFKDQAANGLLLSVLDEYEDSGTTQKKDDTNTSAKNATTNSKLITLYVRIQEIEKRLFLSQLPNLWARIRLQKAYM